MSKKIPKIKDKYDVVSAEQIVQAELPVSNEQIEDLIFWSCFADPVSKITTPYIHSLSDTELADPMANFVRFHLMKNQVTIVRDAFNFFIEPRGESFRLLVVSKLNDSENKHFLEVVSEGV
jgi:hypothetical protein